MIEIYQSDDVTLAEDLVTPGYEAGVDSGVVELHVWNSKGDPAGQTVFDLLLVLLTESVSVPGTWLRSGVPPQDELWGRVRISGFDATGDPSWSVRTTDWVAVGSSGGLLVPSIPADCAVHLEVLFHPPGFAKPFSWRHQVGVVANEQSAPVPAQLDALGRGVLTGVGDRSWSSVVSGCEVTAAAVPDEQVHVASGVYVHRGELHGRVTGSVLLDQSDGAAVALGVGESYVAVLTLNPTSPGGVTITKGVKATSPTAPQPPVGEPLLRPVTVAHDPGGLSIIDTADIGGELVRDRYLLVPDPSGLDATLHPGQALGRGSWRYRTRTERLSFAASSTSWVRLQASGLVLVTVDPAPPSDAALLHWEVETDATNITRVDDRRLVAGPSRILTIGGAVPASPGEVVPRVALTVADPELQIDGVVVDFSDAGGGTAGQTVVDVLVSGSSIFPGSGTEDLRPVLPHDAVILSHTTSNPELRRLRRGERVSVITTEHPVGGAPADVRVQLLCR